MAGKVVELHPHQVDAELVAELEGMLAEARSGEIVGVAYAACHKDHSVSQRYVGRISYGTAGALFAVLRRVTEQLDEVT